MKISCICRIASPQHEEEIVLYAIEAPHSPSDEQIEKCSKWVEHAYKNGFFHENKGIFIDHSYRDTFQMVGAYLPKEISDEHLEKYDIIISNALRLSGLVGSELSEEERVDCLNYKPVVEVSKMIDKWMIEELYGGQNIESVMDN